MTVDQTEVISCRSAWEVAGLSHLRSRTRSNQAKTEGVSWKYGVEWGGVEMRRTGW